MWVFTSNVHLCLSIGDTVVRRGERLLRRHLGEVAKPRVIGLGLGFENRP